MGEEHGGQKKGKDLPFRRHGVSVAAVPPLHFPQHPKTQHAQHEPCGSANPTVDTGTGPGDRGLWDPLSWGHGWQEPSAAVTQHLQLPFVPQDT